MVGNLTHILYFQKYLQIVTHSIYSNRKCAHFVHMITSLRASIPQVKQVWLADDSAGRGSIESLYQGTRAYARKGENSAISLMVLKAG